MEYGILWVLYRGPADLETDDARGASKKKIVAASVLGCVLTLQLGAFSVTLETLASGITELPFQTFVAVMQPIHLAIGLVEGLITAAVLCFVYEARPELLWGTDESTQRQKARFSLKKTVAILAVLTVWIGGGLSLFASAIRTDWNGLWRKLPEPQN